MIFKLLLILVAILKIRLAAAQCTFENCICSQNADNSQSIYCSGSQTATSFPKRTNIGDSIPIKLLTFELFNVARLTNLFSNLNIDTLQLKQNNLQSIASDAFSGIKNLRQLTIQDFNLKSNSFEPKSLEPIAGTLTGLELSSSGLIDAEINGMYSEISKLTKLTDMNFKSNDLSQFDPKWAPVTLKTLNLDTNNLNEIPVGLFQKLTQLAVLDISSNHFSDMTGLVNNIKASLTSQV